MPDLDDTPTEGELDTPVDAAQGAAETEAPPWGDDFDASKAWGTITKQRESEKELKERLRRLEEDDEAFAELARKRGFQIDDAEEDAPEEPEFEEDDPVAPLNEKLTRLEKWQQEQEAKEMAVQIRTDLDAINTDSDWDLDDEDRQEIVARAARDPKGFNRDALERAHKAFTDRLERAAERGVERAKKPKPKAPHVTPAGAAATGTKSIVDMTPDEHRAWARERFHARANQGT